jgi:hypothetical protein
MERFQHVLFLRVVLLLLHPASIDFLTQSQQQPKPLGE